VRSSWEVWNPAGPAECVVLTIGILPPCPSWLTIWYAGRATVYILRINYSVHSVAVTQFCEPLFLAASSSLSSATSSPFFFLPWERVSLTFFRLSLCQFSDYVPWLPRVVLQLSLEHLWPPLTMPRLPSGHHESHLMWIVGLLMYIIYCAFIVNLRSNSIQFLSLVSQFI
jgi:hypothetical protein